MKSMDSPLSEHNTPYSDNEPRPSPSFSPQNEADDTRSAIRLTIPQRYLVLSSVCALTGLSLGLIRGSREVGLRFLAENAH